MLPFGNEPSPEPVLTNLDIHWRAILLEILKMYPWYEFENYQINITDASSRGQWLNQLGCHFNGFHLADATWHQLSLNSKLLAGNHWWVDIYFPQADKVALWTICLWLLDTTVASNIWQDLGKYSCLLLPENDSPHVLAQESESHMWTAWWIHALLYGIRLTCNLGVCNPNLRTK